MSLFAFAGCSSTFQERHYFKSVDALGRPVNYYRLTVRGGTLLSSSRYVSGYYDEAAVNAYFNEFSQPKGGLIVGAADDESASQSGLQPLATDESTKGPAESGRRILVLLLSSNSDAIAQQIGAFAENEQVLGDLAQLLGRDRIIGARTAEATVAGERERLALVAAVGDQMVAELGRAGITAEEADQAVLKFLNVVAAQLGGPAPFDSLDAAAAWLDLARPSLLATQAE